MLHPLAVFPFDIKTAAVTGVASGQAVLPDLDDDRIGITVSQYFHYLLSIAGLLTFHPVLVAGAAEEPGFAVLQSQIKGLFIHEGHHQDFTVLVVLDNGRDQPPILSKSILITLYPSVWKFKEKRPENVRAFCRMVAVQGLANRKTRYH